MGSDKFVKLKKDEKIKTQKVLIGSK